MMKTVLDRIKASPEVTHPVEMTEDFMRSRLPPYEHCSATETGN